MFINTKKAVKITHDKSREVFEAKAGWIGEIPKWVEEHWYFNALCKDGSITAIVSAKDKEIQNALYSKSDGGGDAALAALRARASELKISRANQLGKDKLIAAIAEAEAKQQKPAEPPNPDDDPPKADGGWNDGNPNPENGN